VRERVCGPVTDRSDPHYALLRLLPGTKAGTGTQYHPTARPTVAPYADPSHYPDPDQSDPHYALPRLRFGVWDLVFWVYGLWFMVQGLGFGVEGVGSRV